jgi:integrase
VAKKQDVDPLLDWEWRALRPHLEGEYKTFFPLLLISGVRTSEALALGAGDLWRENGRAGISVRRLKRDDAPVDRLQIPNAKIFADLEGLGRMHRKHLFGFQRVAAWKALKRFCRLAGLRPLSPHQFRHTYSVLFTRTRQLDPVTGQAMTALDMRIQLAWNLGHTTIDTVEIYFRPHGDDLLGRTASVGESYGSTWFSEV